MTGGGVVAAWASASTTALPCLLRFPRFIYITERDAEGDRDGGKGGFMPLRWRRGGVMRLGDGGAQVAWREGRAQVAWEMEERAEVVREKEMEGWRARKSDRDEGLLGYRGSER
eukprot:TRINITY_DN42985_c0_g2_i3.p1 TRINITY_DN42985_c0_g2~~TRINITY_DN42985_c0_g2_i3.p1  ORF type:complete len:114 (+),score=22.72 TRINITY_DN42985_c0_g2_i3:3-344(+)